VRADWLLPVPRGSARPRAPAAGASPARPSDSSYSSQVDVTCVNLPRPGGPSLRLLTFSWHHGLEAWSEAKALSAASVDQRADGAAGRVGQLSFRASAVLYSPTTGPRYRFGATERVTARPGSCEQIKAERGRTKATQFLTMTTLGAAIALLAVLSAAPTPTVGQETLCGGSSCESCTWMYNSPCPGGGTCPEGGCAEAVELLQ
jgi:hypothetical protein